MGLEEINLDRMELTQNRLAAALIKQASVLGLAAKDWIEGGWSRGKSVDIMDKIDIGYTVGERMAKRGETAKE